MRSALHLFSDMNPVSFSYTGSLLRLKGSVLPDRTQGAIPLSSLSGTVPLSCPCPVYISKRFVYISNCFAYIPNRFVYIPNRFAYISKRFAYISKRFNTQGKMNDT